MSIANEIHTLVEYLNARTKEYDEGHPTISDLEWDKKYFELQELEKRYSIYFNDSPTQSISYEVVNSLEKVAHNHAMLSLEKTKDLTVIKDFLGNVPYLAMCKMDGLTCSLKYIDGVLVSAETRGNGEVGENILHNAKVIPSIPKQIPYKEELVVDGEIICSYSDFESFKDEYANPRNFASGSIRLLDAGECAKRKLQFIAWDVIEGLEDSYFLTDKFVTLSEFGFTIVPYYVYNDCEEEINKLTLEAETLHYPIDGIVFKFDDVEYGRSLGRTSHHLKNAMAYKFYDEVAKTYLTGIDWTMGRTGALTPVAVFEEVDLDGSTISRASIHNLSVMEDLLGLPYTGQEIEIFKANMIIPQIKSAVKNPVGKELITTPGHCPICGEKTIIKMDNFSKILFCDNPACDGKLINKLDHFCGKKGLDIKGLSKATLEKLIDWGWVSNYIDLFKLNSHRDEWIKKPGFGPKSVDNILSAVEAGRECELSAFISALGIPLIGSTASKELVKIFPTWEEYIGAVESGYYFWSIAGFGAEMHSAITRFDYTEAKTIYNDYLTINSTNENCDEVMDSLANITVVITGKVNKYKNRDDFKTAIERRGGKVAGSISGKTSYLINNDVNSTSSKNISAKKLGVPIISEDDFIEMFAL